MLYIFFPSYLIAQVVQSFPCTGLRSHPKQVKCNTKQTFVYHLHLIQSPAISRHPFLCVLPVSSHKLWVTLGPGAFSGLSPFLHIRFHPSPAAQQPSEEGERMNVRPQKRSDRPHGGHGSYTWTRGGVRSLRPAWLLGSWGTSCFKHKCRDEWGKSPTFKIHHGEKSRKRAKLAPGDFPRFSRLTWKQGVQIELFFLERHKHWSEKFPNTWSLVRPPAPNTGQWLLDHQLCCFESTPALLYNRWQAFCQRSLPVKQWAKRG